MWFETGSYRRQRKEKKTHQVQMNTHTDSCTHWYYHTISWGQSSSSLVWLLDFCKKRQQTRLEENFTLGGPTRTEDHCESVCRSVERRTSNRLHVHQSHCYCLFVEQIHVFAWLTAQSFWGADLKALFTSWRSLTDRLQRWLSVKTSTSTQIKRRLNGVDVVCVCL